MATHLGIVRGTGAMVVGQDRFDGIAYDIDVWLDEQACTTSADGGVTGNLDALDMLFSHGTAVLELETGGAVEFLITDMDLDSAAIMVTGPVPGF
jgi:hypothetical protein